MEIKLGSKVRDRVTGITGIAVARIEYLNGCIQYCLVPAAKKGDTARPDGVYLDMGQLEVIGDGLNIPKRRTGGPQIDARGHNHGQRQGLQEHAPRGPQSADQRHAGMRTGLGGAALARTQQGRLAAAVGAQSVEQ